jgi:hypothetical protein
MVLTSRQTPRFCGLIVAFMRLILKLKVFLKAVALILPGLRRRFFRIS